VVSVFVVGVVGVVAVVAVVIAEGWRWLTGSTPKHLSRLTGIALNIFKE
jgi:hypothetical protein